MAVNQDFIDEQFLTRVREKYPNSAVKDDLEAAKKKYAKLYKSVAAELSAPDQETPGWQTFLRTRFGWLVDLYDSVPDLKTTLDTAVKQGWTSQTFQNAVMSTAWWKATDKRVRNFTTLQASDPTTLQTEIERQADAIRSTIQKAGYSLDDKAINDLATRAFKFGWSDVQLDKYVGSEIARIGTVGTTGEKITAGPDAALVRRTAASFGVKLTDADVEKYTNDLVGKAITAEQLNANLKADAANLYPSIRAQLDQGRTFEAIVAPYRKYAADYLDLDVEQIDMTDTGRWGQLLTYVDPATKETRMMNVSEWSAYLRQQPEWQKTDSARNLYRTAASKLVRAFGAVRG